MSKYRLPFFKVIAILLVVIATEIIGYLGLYINSKSFDYLSNKNYFNIRAMLTGNTNPAMLPKYLSLPYLGYIPYPKYTKNGIVQHNEDGYRGYRVPLEKTKKYRILCIGGSTTYGFGVDLPTQTYPAQLEQILNRYIKQDSLINKKYTGVEVINAGIEAATSAEELQQYLFKYRYYHADAVVIHNGVNDALLMSELSDNFQLDYTHYRRLTFHLNPLPAPAVWLLKSNFFSFLIIRLFYNDFSNAEFEFKKSDNQKYCKWSRINIETPLSYNDNVNYPFYKNTQTLFNEILNDSAKLFVLPEVLNEKSAMVKANKKYMEYYKLNHYILTQLSRKQGIRIIPFSFDSVKISCWIDDCHVNKIGEATKAKILSQYIFSEILHNQ